MKSGEPFHIFSSLKLWKYLLFSVYFFCIRKGVLEYYKYIHFIWSKFLQNNHIHVCLKKEVAKSLPVMATQKSFVKQIWKIQCPLPLWHTNRIHYIQIVDTTEADLRIFKAWGVILYRFRILSFPSNEIYLRDLFDPNPSGTGDFGIKMPRVKRCCGQWRMCSLYKHLGLQY